MGKRRIIGLIIGVLLILAAGGCVAYYYANQEQTPAVNTAAKEEVGKLNLKGDQTIAAQYAAALNDDDAEAAQGIFDDAVKNAKDQQGKLEVLAQNVTYALEYKQQEAALKAALAAAELRPSFETYNDAYRVYVAMGNYPKQKEMLQKAIETLKASDNAKKDQILPVLNQQLAEVDRQLSEAGNS